MSTQNKELCFNIAQWMMRFNKYNQDYEKVDDKTIITDKDFIIPNPPSPIMQEWFDTLREKVKVHQDIDAKIYLFNKRIKIQQAIELKFEII